MNATILRRQLAERLAAVEDRLAAACRKAGRCRDEVTLVGVTKTVSTEMAAGLVDLGVVNLGESRPQELWRKAPVLPRSVVWHLIGHLQRNKVERTLPLVEWIHSVDSLRLLEALEHEAAKQKRIAKVLLEVNASHESSKHGFVPADVTGLSPALGKLKHVQVHGLMTMAALEEDAERCRPTFAALRDLRDRLRQESGLALEHLSMGMSNDYAVAVEEGATMVRIGSALFQGVTA